MIFALLFIAVFLISALIYFFTRRWIIASAIPLILFVLSTMTDTDASDVRGITLIFGLPIVFFATLLGAYVVQMRYPQEDSEEIEEG